jgi:hypothetical protein
MNFVLRNTDPHLEGEEATIVELPITALRNWPDLAALNDFLGSSTDIPDTFISIAHLDGSDTILVIDDHNGEVEAEIVLRA